MAFLRKTASAASLLMLFLAMVLGSASISLAQDQTAGQTAPPDSVERFLDLLKDPAVQTWLQQQAAASAAPVQPPVAADTPPSMADFTMRFRGHLASLVAAARSFPDESAHAAAMLRGDMAAGGGTRPVFLVLAFVLAGLAGQFLFKRLSARWRARIDGSSTDTTRDRVAGLSLRLVWGVCSTLSFGLASIGFFLLFDWPPLVREVVVGYLFAVVAYFLAWAVFDVFLAPASVAGQPFRLIPTGDQLARFWARRLSYLVAFFAFGSVTVRLLGTFGYSGPSRLLVAYCLGLVLLAIVIQAIWSRPADTSPLQPPRFARNLTNWLWTAYFAAMWLLWAAAAERLFWIAAICAALPAALAITKASFRNILRSPSDTAESNVEGTIVSIVLERGIRAALIVGSLVLLAHVLDVNLTQMTMQDAPGLRILRGILSAGIIVLVVDLAWNVVKLLIDQLLTIGTEEPEVGSAAAHKRARVRTLLPILRNFLMVLFAAIAIMMGLSSIGIEIGPLIAGAGVVGVAIGFGAQSVVKDIISGVFYLLDDAFRVGEYIQSGNYRGTVEGFSLRSIRLRHHRGPIYIVPFSELGTVQNMGRDWSVIKFLLSVSHDSDVAKVKAITKTVGKALKEDPEFSPFFIENLKMKGIDEINDHGIKLSFGMTLKPTQLQSAIRRRAYAMLRQAFSENGISIAVPTVKVYGSKEDDLAAAAQQAVAMSMPPALP